jgi:hypothetical protein
MSDSVTLPFDVSISRSMAFTTIRSLLPALDEPQLKLLLVDIGGMVGADVNLDDGEHNLFLRLRAGIASLPDHPVPDQESNAPTPLPTRRPGEHYPATDNVA